MTRAARNRFATLLALLATTGQQALYAEEAAQTIADAMPSTQIASTEPTVIEGLYEVVAGDNVLYVDKTGRYLVVGSIYDLKDDIDLSAKRRAEVAAARTTDSLPAAKLERGQNIPLTDAIVTGAGRKTLTIITDPNCVWCRRLWNESVKDLDGFTVRHLLVIESERSVGILCSSNPADSLDRAFQVSVTSVKTTVPTPDCKRDAAAQISRMVRFAEEVGVLATPVLIRGDGAIHAGYLGRSELIQWLGDENEET